jgi:hypothetical protein
MSSPQSSPDNPLYQSFLQGAPGRPPIHKWHHYFDIYHQHFEPFRGRRPVVLEIGVQNGGSLHLWRDYFGPDARLFGMDIDPACADRAPQGAKVFIGDQADPDFLKAVLRETGPLDVVIDDGGHTARQQIVSFETLYPAMKPEAVYLVEDTHTAFWGGRWSDDPEGRNFLSYAFRVAVSLHDWTRQLANFGRLGIDPDQRTEAAPASELCRTTASVAFYDSVVVFTRRPRPEPWHDQRDASPPRP